MNARDIERYRLLVGNELIAMGVQEPIELLLIGGGYMLTQIKNRTATGDVDAMVVHPNIYSDSEVYRLFRAAIKFVADDEGLDAAWFSIDVGDFLRAAGPLPKMALWKKFGLLYLYVPPKDFILAHKLLAGRAKDMSDIEALCRQLHINSRKKAQKVLDKHIKREIQENSDVAETMYHLFG